ncbi:MAG TPA: LLM class F420-dependent oxidoreductase [Candidatus Binatia bacterium]|jgi:probable F420-dependent oxidoreductase
MKFGVFLPISGRAAGPETLMDAARQAETLGYDSVWCADRIIIPWEIKTPYPYSEGRSFIVPPDRPFFEPLTCLAFLAGCTENISLGISVLVLPYRQPLYWAKIATTIDHLSKGRLILGVGVGWMVEEFEALGANFAERGELSDEQLDLLAVLWRDERAKFSGRHYRFDDIAFYPKPLQKPRIPIWVGGEGARAQRRAGEHGDAWFPYFVRMTPAELARRFDNVRRAAEKAGRDPDRIRLNCCLPIDLGREALTPEKDQLGGSAEQVREALEGYERIGVEHLALQFMVPHYPERVEQIERFAREVIPAFKNSPNG